MEIKQLKIILLLVFCFQLNTVVYSQLKGVVMDSDKFRPIPGATIFINNTDLSAQTNEAGSFSLEGVSERFAEVVIYKKGFTLFKSSIMLEKAKVYTLNFNLSPKNKIKEKSKSSLLTYQTEFQERVFATAVGYSRPRQFRLPNYEAGSKDASPSKDKRATLYWNPELKINSSGLGKVVFYAADVPTKYRVTIEGITENNMPIRSEHELEIGK